MFELLEIAVEHTLLQMREALVVVESVPVAEQQQLSY